MNECPCEDCICLAICRNKPYWNLFRECDLLRPYLHFDISYMAPGNTKRICKIRTTLKPTEWGVRKIRHSSAAIFNKRRHKYEEYPDDEE